MRLDKPLAVEGVITWLELRFTPSGRQVASLQILTGTRAVQCEGWGEIADTLVTQYDTGSKIAVIGSNRTTEYVDHTGSKVHYSVLSIREIVRKDG